VQDRAIFDRRRHRRAIDAIGEFPHRLAQDLARPGLRQSGDDVDASERGDRSDLPAHQGDEFVDDSVRIGRLGGVAENDEGAGDLALALSWTPMTAVSATAGWEATTASMMPVDRR